MCLWISTPVKSLGFKVDYLESAAGASALCHTVIDRVAAAGGRVCVLHSDNGSVMTSMQVAQVCEDHRVVQSFIRPRVSNDNAHGESLFGTVKTRLDYPVVSENVVHTGRRVVGTVPDRVELVVYSTKGALWGR